MSLVGQKQGNQLDDGINAAPSSLKKEYQRQRDPSDRPIDDDATSRCSTLDGDTEEVGYTENTKKPLSVVENEIPDDEPASPAPAPRIPGPLESQLAALMSKLIYLEHANPAVAIKPEEYQEMQARLKSLEEEKKNWWKRHEAIWALRDEDVENNIKIRGMLAKCRRDLEATQALRNEDLINVQVVRSKLAEKTRELERVQAQTGRASPSRGRPGSFFERRGTSDLFTAAKVAALEQRALELERRNSDLVAQLDSSRVGMNIDDLNRLTAHEAWKDTVAELESKLKAKDAEIARLRPVSSAGVAMDWYRVEALLEEHANYREVVGGRLQALRSEKETLQKDLHAKENDCQALELKVQILQRRASVL
ncbi:Nn.00g038140.m01.CDS01 [Neocucurbitaria sp. VM-36]